MSVLPGTNARLMADLFSNQHPLQHPLKQEIAPGLTLIKGLVSDNEFVPLIQKIIEHAPLRHMMTPMGHASKVAMSNCGPFGWVSDQLGYRYSARDPMAESPWPQMPESFLRLAQQAAHLAGIEHFVPDAGLINYYEIGVGMGKHQDVDETDFHWPIVSVSLGLSAVFQVSGDKRTGKNINILLENCDVLVIHGPARRFFHGIRALKADPLQPNLTHRYNLTLRKAL